MGKPQYTPVRASRTLSPMGEEWRRVLEELRNLHPAEELLSQPTAILIDELAGILCTYEEQSEMDTSLLHEQEDTIAELTRGHNEEG